MKRSHITDKQLRSAVRKLQRARRVRRAKKAVMVIGLVMVLFFIGFPMIPSTGFHITLVKG
jgi:hypothetical protein